MAKHKNALGKSNWRSFAPAFRNRAGAMIAELICQRKARDIIDCKSSTIFTLASKDAATPPGEERGMTPQEIADVTGFSINATIFALDDLLEAEVVTQVRPKKGPKGAIWRIVRPRGFDSQPARADESKKARANSRVARALQKSQPLTEAKKRALGRKAPKGARAAPLYNARARGRPGAVFVEREFKQLSNTNTQTANEPSPAEQAGILEILAGLGFDPDRIQELTALEQCTLEQVRIARAVVERARQRGTLSDPASLAEAAIRDRYTLPMNSADEAAQARRQQLLAHLQEFRARQLAEAR